MFSRKIEEMNPWEFMEQLDGNPDEEFVVIDVREPAEYYGDMGHIKGSLHIPLMELKDRITQLSDDKRKKVFVCSSGERSYYACSFLKDQGVDGVINLRGGLIQWHLSGLDVEYE